MDIVVMDYADVTVTVHRNIETEYPDEWVCEQYGALGSVEWMAHDGRIEVKED